MHGLAPPYSSLVYSRHIEAVRYALRAERLPVSAEGITVYIPDLSGHGEAVARTVAGPVGLAQGADVLLWETGAGMGSPRQQPGLPNDIIYAWKIRMELLRGCLTGNGTLEDVAKAAVIGVARTYYDKAAELIIAMSLPSDSPTVRFVNMSWGRCIWSEAEVMCQMLCTEPKILLRLVADRIPKPYSIDGKHELKKHLATLIANEYDTESGQILKSARAHLESVAKMARAIGFLLFISKGNIDSSLREVAPAWFEQVTIDTQYIIPVGATVLTSERVGDSLTAAITPHRRCGIDAPGVGVPVAARSGLSPALANGTSYAAPYALATAALMVKVNPYLTPNEIEEILYHPEVSEQLPGSCYGVGVLDPVKAVRYAASKRRW
jgi:subtilisin family serine protease